MYRLRGLWVVHVDQPPSLELYLLQRPIEDIKEKSYHFQLLAQIWRSLQDFHIFFHSLLQTASVDINN